MVKMAGYDSGYTGHIHSFDCFGLCVCGLCECGKNHSNDNMESK
jgi:hypothetical protein